MDGVNNQADNESTTIRLISSGIVAVERAQPRLDVGDGDASLDRDQGAGERGVDVTEHDDLVDRVDLEPFLERGHYAGGLHGVRPRAHAEVDVGLRNAEVPEQGLRHRPVVVLPRVDEQRLLAHLPQRPHQGRDLHEVRSRTSDQNLPHRRLLCCHHAAAVIAMNRVLPTR